jgi:hypothetical protein
MQDEAPWVKQRNEKYRNHDLAIEDLKPIEIDMIRAQAINTITRTREFDAVKITIEAFMAHIANAGYRITKVEKK